MKKTQNNNENKKANNVKTFPREEADASDRIALSSSVNSINVPRSSIYSHFPNALKRGIHTGIDTDPLGSWTGTPSDDKYSEPVQDADDL